MPDLGPNRLQRLSADDMSGKVLMQKVKYNGFDPKLSEPGKTFFFFYLILYVPSTIFQLYRDGPPWVEPVLS